MKLLIVVATKAELAPFFENFALPNGEFVEHSKFDLLITGVGMVATAFSMGKYLTKSYEFVLNVGIAGSFDKSLDLGSLVSINIDVFAELGAENHEGFLTLNELGFGENTFEATYIIENLPEVKAITVNKVHGNSKSIAIALQRFAPTVESMEGAAVFYSCNQLQVKCAQVRSISNVVEPRAKENWKIGLAIRNLNEWLINFIEKRN